MNSIYNIAIYIASFLLNLVAIFNPKIRLFIDGRKYSFEKIKSAITSTDDVIWFHCASLGEFEQGRPIIEIIKSTFPNYKIVLTFFSPSGYEVRKNYEYADVIVYLPLDTKTNARKFLDLVHPKMAVFVKYEFWPNILKELHLKNIETILVSGIFREDQAFFKFYGKWIKKSLATFTHFFVQNKTSEILLHNSGFNNVTLSGDTRFDRVYEITNQDNQLEFIENFKQNKITLIAGSTWPKDEELLVDYINFHASEDEKFIIAPHNIEKKDIHFLKKSIQKKSILLSEIDRDYSAQVFIIDAIGILTKIYSYADLAYIGGGFGKNGIHNILEPATFGVPVLIGPNYKKFQEAVDLVGLRACKVINNSEDLNNHLKLLFNDINYRKAQGKLTKEYILSNTGASKIILNYITKKI